MAEVFEQLLDAAISHLQGMKRRGVLFVPVSAGTLAAFAEKPAPAGRAQRQPPRIPQVPSSRPRAFAAAAAPPASKAIVVQEGAAAKPVASPATLLPVVVPSSGKAEALAVLRERVLQCAKCGHLATARKNVVFGVGNPDAELMFVGEAPGADEDLIGEPFVGRAGQLLTRMLRAMSLSREQVYIANILKCRPDTPGQQSGNRAPTPEEMSTCIPHLHEQIDIIRPKVLVALGGVALSGLLGKTGISKLRGNWLAFRDIPLMPTFHPSYLLRPENEAQKRVVWEDMLQVMERLNLPTTEKQLNYFKKQSP